MLTPFGQGATKKKFLACPWDYKLRLRSTCPDFFRLCAVSPSRCERRRAIVFWWARNVVMWRQWMWTVLDKLPGRPACPAQELTCPEQADRGFVAPCQAWFLACYSPCRISSMYFIPCSTRYGLTTKLNDVSSNAGLSRLWPFHSQEWSISNFPCSLTRNITPHYEELGFS